MLIYLLCRADVSVPKDQLCIPCWDLKILEQRCCRVAQIVDGYYTETVAFREALERNPEAVGVDRLAQESSKHEPVR